MAVTAASINFQSYQFQTIVASGTWRWTTRVDVSSSAPVYEIVDILTPFGILRDSIPLPGEVVQCMNDSIVQLQTNFPPTILLGPPPDLTFDVDWMGNFDGGGPVILGMAPPDMTRNTAWAPQVGAF